jgi:eukaryotic-like serine/threonine-protein kinase
MRFELTEPVGKGAFGAVWKARDKTTDADIVAVKIIFDKYRQDQKMMARFVQEAKILEKLDHPNICRSLAWDADGPDVFLAMEYIDGETLDEKFAGNSKDNSPVPLEGIAWICDQLCAAIDYAHRNGIIHRDLKPKNVMVNRRGQKPFVKVLDFGIAKMLVGSELDPTTVGRVLGSVLYISPEQVLGAELTHRADVFSLGTILFELVTLKRAWARDEDGTPLPFHKVVPQGSLNSHVSVLRRIARESRPLPTAARSELPKGVDTVLMRAMSIKPEDRYDSAEKFALAFRAALVGEATPKKSEENTVSMKVDPEVTAAIEAERPEPQQQPEPIRERAPEAALERSVEIAPAQEAKAAQNPMLAATVALLAVAVVVIVLLLLK